MSSNPNRSSRLLLASVLVCLVVGVLIYRYQPSRQELGSALEISRHDMVQNDGLWYRIGQTNPFTGRMVDYYTPGGELLSRSEISNGLFNGLSETWFTNGQLQVRETFQAGLSHGPREKWHENGTKLSEATIVEGKITGTFQSWYDNGQLNEKIEMKHGEPDGVAWAYYPSGFLKAQTTVAAGKVLDRKVWPDGQRRTPP